MGKKSAASGILAAAIAFALTLGVATADAQSASDFVGKWTITFDAPAGGGMGGGPGAGGAGGGGGGGGGGMRGGMRAPTVLDIALDGNALVATMTGGMGGGPGGNAQPRTISDVKIVDGSLVLTYTVNMMQGGEAAPVTLKLTPAGTTTRAEMDMAGRFQRTGTATKE